VFVSMLDSFLSDTEVVAQLHATVFSLESSMRAQSDIDNAYAEICMAIQKRNVRQTVSDHEAVVERGIDIEME
jgi:hypothetical protein